MADSLLVAVLMDPQTCLPMKGEGLVLSHHVICESSSLALHRVLWCHPLAAAYLFIQPSAMWGGALAAAAGLRCNYGILQGGGTLITFRPSSLEVPLIQLFAGKVAIKRSLSLASFTWEKREVNWQTGRCIFSELASTQFVPESSRSGRAPAPNPHRLEPLGGLGGTSYTSKEGTLHGVHAQV